MLLLNVIYYQYFLFYKKVIKDPEPHLATVLALSFSQSLLVNAIMYIIALKWFCYEIKVWVQFTLVLLLIFFNYLIYHRTGIAKEIIKQKPFIVNKGLSIAITWLFFFITVSWLFWGSIYGRHLLSQCR
jgi:hypothetical protein